LIFYEEDYSLEFIDLKAMRRTNTGKGVARKLRQSDQIPAVLYGKGIDPQLLTLAVKDLDIIFRKHGRARLFFNVKIDDEGTSRKAFLKALQVDTVSGKFSHMDLHQISMDQTLRITIPVVTTGTSIGVESGGLLQIIRRELEVICLPQNIPESIEVDVSQLDIGASIHVSELSLPDAITVPYDVDFTVLTVVQPKGYDTGEEEAETEDEESAESETPESTEKEK
jgi:large subunit ribosomal protein L25